MPIDRRQLEIACRQLAPALDHELPQLVGTDQRAGFVVMLFEFGAGGNLAYISNAQRADMIKAVREWLDRQEAGLTSDPLGKRAAT